jgi:hypothetical protein
MLDLKVLYLMSAGSENTALVKYCFSRDLPHVSANMTKMVKDESTDIIAILQEGLNKCKKLQTEVSKSQTLQKE